MLGSMQWGYAGNQGWEMATWYVEQFGSAIHSPFQAIPAGDKMASILSAFNCDNAGDCDWWLSGQQVGSGSVATAMIVQNPEEFPFTFVAPSTLEAYGVVSCNQLPSTNAFFANAYIYQPGQTVNDDYEVTRAWNKALAGSTNPMCSWGVQTVTRGATLQY